jgi:hypothetical protein
MGKPEHVDTRNTIRKEDMPSDIKNSIRPRDTLDRRSRLIERIDHLTIKHSQFNPIIGSQW